MYRITYNYFERDKINFQPKGMPIYGKVEAKTIKQLNKAFAEVRNYHDVYKYTLINFKEIEEF